MKIDSVRFYVNNAEKTSNWFTNYLGFQVIDTYQDEHTHTKIIAHNSIYFIISSAINQTSPVAEYLSYHPEGIVDIAFQVNNLQTILDRATELGIEILQPLHQQSKIKYARIAGWDCLEHSLIESPSETNYYFLPNLQFKKLNLNSEAATEFTAIDHIVLNVGKSKLSQAVKYYQNLFNWRIQQTFKIRSKLSGLYSQALVDETSQVQFNINEPTDPNSQIQKFIELNGGAGIQHLALRSPSSAAPSKSSDLISTIAKMRSRGVNFLPISSAYYQQLNKNIKENSLAITPTELQSIEQQGILVDWHQNTQESLLMQIFTHPILEHPTFFIEFIERRQQATGFGEGNFQALYEAVEIDQIKQ